LNRASTILFAKDSILVKLGDSKKDTLYVPTTVRSIKAPILGNEKLMPFPLKDTPDDYFSIIGTLSNYWICSQNRCSFYLNNNEATHKPKLVGIQQQIETKYPIYWTVNNDGTIQKLYVEGKSEFKLGDIIYEPINQNSSLNNYFFTQLMPYSDSGALAVSLEKKHFTLFLITLDNSQKKYTLFFLQKSSEPFDSSSGFMPTIALRGDSVYRLTQSKEGSNKKTIIKVANLEKLKQIILPTKAPEKPSNPSPTSATTAVTPKITSTPQKPTPPPIVSTTLESTPVLVSQETDIARVRAQLKKSKIKLPAAIVKKNENFSAQLEPDDDFKKTTVEANPQKPDQYEWKIDKQNHVIVTAKKRYLIDREFEQNPKKLITISDKEGFIQYNTGRVFHIQLVDLPAIPNMDNMGIAHISELRYNEVPINAQNIIPIDANLGKIGIIHQPYFSETDLHAMNIIPRSNEPSDLANASQEIFEMYTADPNIILHPQFLIVDPKEKQSHTTSQKTPPEQLKSAFEQQKELYDKAGHKAKANTAAINRLVNQFADKPTRPIAKENTPPEYTSPPVVSTPTPPKKSWFYSYIPDPIKNAWNSIRKFLSMIWDSLNT
jgi:hypothetical protein